MKTTLSKAGKLKAEVVYVALEGLQVDQYYKSLNPEKLKRMIEKWDDKKLDPIVIYNDPAIANKSKIVDGRYRAMAARETKHLYIPAIELKTKVAYNLYTSGAVKSIEAVVHPQVKVMHLMSLLGYIDINVLQDAKKKRSEII